MELAAARQAGLFQRNWLRGGGKPSKKRILAVIGIITMIGRKTNRDAIRKAWMPTGRALEKLEDEKGNVLRFLTGRSANCGDCLDRKLIMKTGSLMTSLFLSIFHTRAHDDVCTGSWLGFM